MKKFWNNFKEFAFRGNVFDLAIGVIIGAAFQGVVTSLTDNIISPLIGLILKADLSKWSFTVLGVEITYGAFISAVINFLILALVVFLIVSLFNKLKAAGKKEEEAKEPTTKKCPYCCTEIDIKATRCPHCTSELEE